VERWTVKEVAIASAVLRERERSKRSSRGERMKNLVRYLQSGEFLDEIKDRREKSIETALSTPELRIQKKEGPELEQKKVAIENKPKAEKPSDPAKKFKRVVYGRFKTE
jgi:hypothetical protein